MDEGFLADLFIVDEYIPGCSLYFQYPFTVGSLT